MTLVIKGGLDRAPRRRTSAAPAAAAVVLPVPSPPSPTSTEAMTAAVLRSTSASIGRKSPEDGTGNQRRARQSSPPSHFGGAGCSGVRIADALAVAVNADRGNDRRAEERECEEVPGYPASWVGSMCSERSIKTRWGEIRRGYRKWGANLARAERLFSIRRSVEGWVLVVRALNDCFRAGGAFDWGLFASCRAARLISLSAPRAALPPKKSRRSSLGDRTL